MGRDKDVTNPPMQTVSAGLGGANAVLLVDNGVLVVSRDLLDADVAAVGKRLGIIG